MSQTHYIDAEFREFEGDRKFGTFGPFHDWAAVEVALVGLAARDDCLNATVRSFGEPPEPEDQEQPAWTPRPDADPRVRSQ